MPEALLGSPWGTHWPPRTVHCTLAHGHASVVAAFPDPSRQGLLPKSTWAGRGPGTVTPKDPYTTCKNRQLQPDPAGGGACVAPRGKQRTRLQEGRPSSNQTGPQLSRARHPGHPQIPPFRRRRAGPSQAAVWGRPWGWGSRPDAHRAPAGGSCPQSAHDSTGPRGRASRQPAQSLRPCLLCGEPGSEQPPLGWPWKTSRPLSHFACKHLRKKKPGLLVMPRNAHSCQATGTQGLPASLGLCWSRQPSRARPALPEQGAQSRCPVTHLPRPRPSVLSPPRPGYARAGAAPGANTCAPHGAPDPQLSTRLSKCS